ncbi:MAG: M48 family metalloprotease [Proteobacteria bacterium]|nr:M48 family metalloprotease [Pseudomonadota bacterium]MBS0572733.1 M48 family metalloprotease [Pseudomonadota bacterium]
MKRPILTGLVLLALLGCTPAGPMQRGDAGLPYAAPDPAMSPRVAAANFAEVVDRMQPVARDECRRRLPQGNCAFRIVVDTTPGAPANAYQQLDGGRPVIAFTVALIAEARNTDELAFVMGHEAAHHILQHISREERSAVMGAVLSGAVVAALGGDPGSIRSAQQMGAQMGAQSYSKEFELEADALGTVLAYRAGFDPGRGALFFNRLPNPSGGFLSTHPPNAERLAVVRQVLAELR